MNAIPSLIGSHTSSLLIDPSLWAESDDYSSNAAVIQSGVSAGSSLVSAMNSNEYHANRDILSSSLLKYLLVSPAYFKEAIDSFKPSTAPMDFGTVVHALTLEPTLVSQVVAIYPGVKSLTKEYREFEALYPDRLVMDEPTFQHAVALCNKIKNRLVKGRPFYKFIEEGQCEASIFFTEPSSSLAMKVRFDLLHPEFSFDLKTTRYHFVDDFVRDALNKNYDLSAYMYSLGRCLFEGSSIPKPFVFLAACTDELSGPIHVLDVGESFLSNGAKKFQEAVSIFHACSTIGVWPDNSTDRTIEITPWQEFKPDRAWALPTANQDLLNQKQ